MSKKRLKIQHHSFIPRVNSAAPPTGGKAVGVRYGGRRGKKEEEAEGRKEEGKWEKQAGPRRSGIECATKTGGSVTASQ